MNWWREKPYLTAHEKRQKAKREARRLAKTGTLSPVEIAGRKIASSFWGKAWCDNLESYRDYESRLPRGRSYVRNGSVVDLRIEAGLISARVSGSDLYTVRIQIKSLESAHWKQVRTACAGQIGSLIELLEGKLSDRVMGIISHRTDGLFPKPAEIEMSCSCPDWATLCKHVAAVLYGVGSRLDAQPELLFRLRNVDHAELIEQASRMEVTRPGKSRGKTIADDALADVFGIEIEAAVSPGLPRTVSKPRRARSVGNSARKKQS